VTARLPIEVLSELSFALTRGQMQHIRHRAQELKAYRRNGPFVRNSGAPNQARDQRVKGEERNFEKHQMAEAL
jgi:hypothetical protein